MLQINALQCNSLSKSFGKESQHPHLPFLSRETLRTPKDTQGHSRARGDSLGHFKCPRVSPRALWDTQDTMYIVKDTQVHSWTLGILRRRRTLKDTQGHSGTFKTRKDPQEHSRTLWVTQGHSGHSGTLKDTPAQSRTLKRTSGHSGDSSAAGHSRRLGDVHGHSRVLNDTDCRTLKDTQAPDGSSA